MIPRYALIALGLLAGADSAPGQSVRFAQGGALMERASTFDSLSSQYRQLAAAASAHYASSLDRREYAHFVRTVIVPQLKIDITGLYVTFDSLAGGGYAVPAALLDLETIDALSKDVERSAWSDTREAFDARAYALNTALQGYFAKTQLLVFPLVNDRLTKAALITAAPQFPIAPPVIEPVTP